MKQTCDKCGGFIGDFAWAGDVTYAPTCTCDAYVVCGNCALSTHLCNLLQDIVYEEDTGKRRDMAFKFRKEVTLFIDQLMRHEAGTV